MQATKKHIWERIRDRLPARARPRLRLLVTQFGQRDLRRWAADGWAVPAPARVKRTVLSRHAPYGYTWIETGTYKGDTANFLATHVAKEVHTIEASPTLFQEAAARFESNERIHVYHGTSSVLLDEILAGMRGNIAFWLDAHHSGGVTHCGDSPTPILAELETIHRNMKSLQQVAIFIDDFSHFDKDPYYPDPVYLVQWAHKHALSWSVEHDIFIMTSKEFSK